MLAPLTHVDPVQPAKQKKAAVHASASRDSLETRTRAADRSVSSTLTVFGARPALTTSVWTPAPAPVEQRLSVESSTTSPHVPARKDILATPLRSV